MFKKVMALVLGLSMMLSIAACGKKVEVPSKSDVKKAAAEEYDMDFKVDSEEISKDQKEAEWVLISKDGSLEVTVTWNAKNPEEFEFDAEEHPEATETEPVVTTETSETSETTEATTAATTAAQAPVPQASVSPLPRSHTRILIVAAFTILMNSVFTLSGKYSLFSNMGPTFSISTASTLLQNTTQWGLPTDTQVTL